MKQHMVVDSEEHHQFWVPFHFKRSFMPEESKTTGWKLIKTNNCFTDFDEYGPIHFPINNPSQSKHITKLASTLEQVVLMKAWSGTCQTTHKQAIWSGLWCWGFLPKASFVNLTLIFALQQWNRDQRVKELLWGIRHAKPCWMGMAPATEVSDVLDSHCFTRRNESVSQASLVNWHCHKGLTSLSPNSGKAKYNGYQPVNHQILIANCLINMQLLNAKEQHSFQN